MDQGDYKHFSHSHSLIMHQMPEGIEVSCSGCNSSCVGTVFVCWQCNFFLHEQCYRATRSLKHPSHPQHPLSLVPYPTYPSNSFYCNSCEIIGTGFSYSCSDCEFDLHVQCAYSISRATSFKKTHLFQELVPQSWINGQNSNMVHNVPFVSVPDHSLPIPFTTSQNPYMPPSSFPDQYHPTGPDVTYVSAPPSRQNSIPSVHDPTTYHNSIASAQYPSMVQTGHSVSNPNYPPNPIPHTQDSVSHVGPSVPDHSLPIPFTTTQNLYMPPSSLPNQYHPTGPDVAYVSAPPSRQNSIPTSHDPTTYHNPIATAQYPSMVQTGHSVSNPSNPPNPIPQAQDSVSHDRPSVTIPTSPENTVPVPLYPSIDHTASSVSVPTNPPNPITSTQDPSTPQHKPSVSIPNISQSSISNVQYSTMGHNGPSVSIPTIQPDPITRPQDPSMPQNGSKNKVFMHFSHPHKLSVVDLQESEENEITCSACEDTLVGKGYSCVEPKCDFHLHESCFNLKKEIRHKSHPEHPLTLLPVAPYNNTNGEFTCNACFSDGTGYTYHCSICTFDLHIQCVNLPETMKRNDHEHELKLFYSCPMKGERENFTCHVCHEEVPKERWVYYCEPCDYGTHLGCVDCEECEGDSTVTDAQAHLQSVMDTQVQLQRLQLQMQMASQQAQFMASMGASLANLV
uniref:uncharacterized protein LOC122596199 n=1 Tax=Erigeron canadensis TaxID=72917 RepID=UPI001CB8FC0A|nr:uncharacterized protein LOC122596199 [Erigeron canadensis]